MSNYLKKFLFAVFILMMPYMNSASKAMDAEDYEESTVRARKVIHMTEDQKDILASINQPTSYQVVEDLEKSQYSLVSSLLSPAKHVIQSTYDTLNFITENPNKALIIGAVLAYQITAIAANCSTACTCYCGNIGGVRTIDALNCAQFCQIVGGKFANCNPC